VSFASPSEGALAGYSGGQVLRSLTAALPCVRLLVLLGRTAGSPQEAPGKLLDCLGHE